MGERMTEELVLQALKQAYRRQHPEQGLLHHSDRGNQYASLDYQKQLQIYKMIGSMSRKGNCYDNACIESFHSVLKKELIYLNKYETREEARKSIFALSTSGCSTIINASILLLLIIHRPITNVCTGIERRWEKICVYYLDRSSTSPNNLSITRRWIVDLPSQGSSP